MSMAITELAAFSEVRVGHDGPLLVTVWRGVITRSTLVQLTEVVEAFVQQHEQFSVLAVVSPHASGEADVNLIRAAAAAIKHFDAAMRGSAVVLLDEGPTAATTRIAVDGLLILVGAPERDQVFSRLEPALAWLGKLPGENPPATPPLQLQDVEGFMWASITPVAVVPPSPSPPLSR